MIPSTIEECNEALNEMLLPDQIILIFKLSREELSTLHHTLGRQIRNNWGLWKDEQLKVSLAEKGFRHPDDMSSTIIKEFWLSLHKLPSEIDKDIAKYNSYWDSVKD